MKIHTPKNLLPAFLIGFAACTNQNAQTADTIRTLNEGTRAIISSNRSIYAELESDSEEAATAYKASIALGKTQLVRKMIDTAKVAFLNQREKFFRGGFEQLRRGLKGVDSSMVQYLTFREEKLMNIGPTTFPEPANDSLTLAQVNCELSLLENQAAVYLRSSVTSGRGYRVSFGCLIGQSTNHLRAGEILTISAGIGAFSERGKPSILIDGNPVELNDGLAVRRIKVTGRSGKHFIKVQISYTDDDGQQQVETKSIDYTIDPSDHPRGVSD